MNQADVIRDGQVDVGYLRLPADVRGLAVEPLFTEPRARSYSPPTTGSRARRRSTSPIWRPSTCCSHPTACPNGGTSPSSCGKGNRGGRLRGGGPCRKSSSTSPSASGSSSSRCPPPSTTAPTSPTSPSPISHPARYASPGTVPGAANSSPNTSLSRSARDRRGGQWTQCCCPWLPDPVLIRVIYLARDDHRCAAAKHPFPGDSLRPSACGRSGPGETTACGRRPTGIRRYRAGLPGSGRLRLSEDKTQGCLAGPPGSSRPRHRAAAGRPSCRRFSSTATLQ